MASAGGIACSEKLVLTLNVGHESTMFDEPAPSKVPNVPPHTHKWTVFVRSVQHQQLSDRLVSKITFRLHQDFVNHKRVVKQPPYEVVETGYAGFIIPISIVFRNSSREHTLSYDMNLRLQKRDMHLVAHSIEFKDPKAPFRSELIKYGAKVVALAPKKAAAAKSGGKPVHIATPSGQFGDLFGAPILKREEPKPTLGVPSKEGRAHSATRDGHKGDKSSADSRHIGHKRPPSSVEPAGHKEHKSRDKEAKAKDKKRDKCDKGEREPAKRPAEATTPECSTVKAKREDKLPTDTLHTSTSAKAHSKSKSPSGSVLPACMGDVAEHQRPLDRDLVRAMQRAVGGDVNDVDRLVDDEERKTGRNLSPLYSTGASSPEPDADREVARIMVPSQQQQPGTAALALPTDRSAEPTPAPTADHLDDAALAKAKLAKGHKKSKEHKDGRSKEKKHKHKHKHKERADGGKAAAHGAASTSSVDHNRLLAVPRGSEGDVDRNGATGRLGAHSWSSGQLVRLRALQSRIMDCDDRQLAEQVAAVVLRHGHGGVKGPSAGALDWSFSSDGARVDFDLCTFPPAELDRLCKAFSIT